MYANSITSQAETQGALLRVTEGIQDSSPPWLRSRLQMLTLPLFNYGTLGSSLNPLSLICKLELTQMITRRNTLVQRSPEYEEDVDPVTAVRSGQGANAAACLGFPPAVQATSPASFLASPPPGGSATSPFEVGVGWRYAVLAGPGEPLALPTLCLYLWSWF